MKIDITSFFFNSKIEGKTATAAWGTAVSKQTEPCFVNENSEVQNVLTGMLFCSKTDKENLSIDGISTSRELMMFSVFDNIYVNGIKIDDCSFILLLVKEHSVSHDGRIILSYPMYATYTKEDGTIVSNEITKNAIAKAIGCSSTGCWFVSDISITNQDTLLFRAYVVDSENPKVYVGTSKERSKEWQSIVDADGSDPNDTVISSHKKSNILDLPLQQIFYGAPGTGKSYAVEEVCKKYTHYRTTFHPDSDYSTFVGCYKPKSDKKVPVLNSNALIAELTKIKNSGTTYPCQKFAAKYWESLKDLSKEDTIAILVACGFTDSMYVEIGKCVAVGESESGSSSNKSITYEFVPQVFTKAYVEAWKKYKDNEPVFLIIEEINRGNCAQIFGDLFQLLDRNAEGFSSYDIDADTDLQQHISSQNLDIEELVDNNEEPIQDELNSGKRLSLPPNLYIWATMNTSDQSLFPIDSAFKRRWDWKYVPIDTRKEFWSIDINGTEYSWSSFLEKINDEIGDTTSSEDKKLGFYFCKAEDGVISCDRFVSKVLFYIYNDVFKDYGLDREFFKDKDNNSKAITFQSLYKMNGDVDDTVVAKLLDNLGVIKISEGTDDLSDTEENTDEDGTTSRDTTRYTIDGETGTFNKCSMVLKVVEKYTQKYPAKTASEFVSEWSEIGNLVKRPQLVISEADFNDKVSRSRDAYVAKRYEKVTLSDGNAYISRGYSIDQMPTLTREFSNRWGIVANVVS